MTKDRKQENTDRKKKFDRVPADVDNDRMIAYNVLCAAASDGVFADRVLTSSLREQKPNNSSFVKELVYGVTKSKSLLDFYIGQLVRDGIRSVKKDLLILLEMGVYQLIYMDSVPDHSAVDESVKIAKKLFRGRAGFVNGVLRNFIRKRDELEKPDDIRSTVKRLCTMYTAHKSIVKLLIDQYGEEDAENILKSAFSDAPLFIHINTTKPEVADLHSGDDSDDDALSVLPVKEIDTKEMTASDAFRKGLFFVQDISSANAVMHLDPKPGETVIDVCSAPGGKSMAAAVRMENKGSVHAMEISRKRLDKVEESKKRLGLTIIDTEPHDGTEVYEKYAGACDKVICDVPCSGLGVMRRKPEIKSRDIGNGRDLNDTQYKILEASSSYVRQGGRIMYSTCTINRYENQDITDKFLGEHPDFVAVDSCLLIPGADSGRTKKQVIVQCTDEDKRKEFDKVDLSNADGFYYCIMERKGRN